MLPSQLKPVAFACICPRQALVVAWASDNRGPPTIAYVQGVYKDLRKMFPSASVNASTFDAFFARTNEPSVKARLPVVTTEIGDGWLYGVPSDPLKNAQ